MIQDDQRWHQIEDVLRESALSVFSRLVAIAIIVQSRKPPTVEDIALTKILAVKYGWACAEEPHETRSPDGDGLEREARGPDAERTSGAGVIRRKSAVQDASSAAGSEPAGSHSIDAQQTTAVSSSGSQERDEARVVLAQIQQFLDKAKVCRWAIEPADIERIIQGEPASDR